MKKTPRAPLLVMAAAVWWLRRLGPWGGGRVVGVGCVRWLQLVWESSCPSPWSKHAWKKLPFLSCSRRIFCLVLATNGR